MTHINSIWLQSKQKTVCHRVYVHIFILQLSAASHVWSLRLSAALSPTGGANYLLSFGFLLTGTADCKMLSFSFIIYIIFCQACFYPSIKLTVLLCNSDFWDHVIRWHSKMRPLLLPFISFSPPLLLLHSGCVFYWRKIFYFSKFITVELADVINGF